MPLPTKRARNPHGEGGRLREELIEAAGRVLAGPAGGDDFSLRAVAREAGVAAPSVYLQFRDKTELVSAVITHCFDQLREAIVAAVAGAETPAERLRAACFAYCRFGLDQPGAYHILFQYQPPAAVLIPFGSPDDAGTRAFATLVDATRDCIEAGVAPRGDPFRQATLLWSAMHGYLSLLRVRRGFPWQPTEDHIDDLISGIVGVPRSRPLLDAGG